MSNKRLSKAKQKLEKLVKPEEGKKKDTSPHVHQSSKIDFQLTIRPHHELTEKQQKYLDVILDKKTTLVFLKGPAGSSKSWLAVYAALLALNAKTQSDVLYLRSPVEVGKSLGFIPGLISDKTEPYLGPLRDKVDEFIPKAEADKLTKDERLVGGVPNYLRGASWNTKFVICDESQNMCSAEMKLISTRLGRFSKIIFLLDESQADVKGKVEAMRYFDIFNNEESQKRGIHCLSFDKTDIVRSPILGYIIERIEGTYSPPDKEKESAPMFDK
jgi:phosphate starvation-inducible PhoH-like protein